MIEGQGYRFVAGTVVENDQALPAPRALRRGAPFTWIRAEDLEGWASSRDGQGGLPELIARLIAATVGGAARVRAPSGDSIRLPGWDVTCFSPVAYPHIPQGNSVWEVSVDARPLAKAKRDLDKRNDKPLGVEPGHTTYVAATLRRLPDRDAWLASARATATWRDVLLVDAVDFEAWLGACSGVATWLATRMGRRPPDLQDLSTFWDEWSGATVPALTPEILLTDRDDTGSGITKWLNGPPAVFALQAETTEEAIAFLYAAIDQYPDDLRMAELSRAVLATDDAARQLAAGPGQLLMVLREPDTGLAKRLAAEGHHVLAAWGPDVSGAFDGRLARPSRFHLQEALEVARVEEGLAYRLSRHAEGSFSTFRRIAEVPEPRPNWAHAPGAEVLAALLAVSWSNREPTDLRVVSMLADVPYEQVERALMPLARFGGPLLRSNDRWKWASPRIGWKLLADQLTIAQIDRLEDAFHSVLSARDPLVDPATTPDDLRRLHDAQASPHLRAGLIEAMTAFSLHGDQVVGLGQARQRVQRAIHQLLMRADEVVWRSLADMFSRLAEASPRGFLAALEETLDSQPDRLRFLLGEEEASAFHDRPFQLLLGALELLAVAPEHMRLCVRLLAQLGSLSPAEACGQAVLRALRKILLFWHPNTAAPQDDRLRALDQVLHDHPALGWNLLVALAPQEHDSTEPMPLPAWHDFGTDQRAPVTWEQIHHGATAVGARLLVHAGQDVARWVELLKLWRYFAPEWRRQAEAQLRNVAGGVNDAAVREELRAALRDVIVRSQFHPGSAWAVAEDDLPVLEAVFESLEYGDVKERHRWLFSSGQHILMLGSTVEQEQAERLRLQIEAARDLTRTLSPAELIDFVGSIDHQNAFATVLATIDLDQDYADELTRSGLRDERPSVGDGITALLQHFAQRKPDLLATLWEQAVRENYGDHALLRVLLAMPTTTATWRLFERRSAALKKSYWRAIEPWSLPEDIATFEVAMKELLAVGRADRVLMWLGSRRNVHLPAELIIQALRAIKPLLTGPRHTMQSHYLGQLFRRLDDDGSCDRSELAELEWTFFEDLRFAERKPRYLPEELARSPEMFVRLIKACYRPDPESGVEAEEEASRESGQKAYGVLSDSRQLPGARPNGTIDGATLEAWVKEALRLCKEAGRTRSGATKIGELLSRVPRVPGQPWPPEPVCEVMEYVRNRDLERGFVTGSINGRGVTSRGLHDGGQLERDEAARFRHEAELLSHEWLRAARCLEALADLYESQAPMHDQLVERLEWP